MRLRVLLGGERCSVSRGSMAAEFTRGKPFTTGDIGNHMLRWPANNSPLREDGS